MFAFNLLDRNGNCTKLPRAVRGRHRLQSRTRRSAGPAVESLEGKCFHPPRPGWHVWGHRHGDPGDRFQSIAIRSRRCAI